MAFKHAARVKMTSTTTGPGTLTVIAPGAANLQSWNAVFGAGPVKVLYVVQGATYFEAGIGTFANAGPTLSRDTVLMSSAGGSLVSLPVATHDVFAYELALFPDDVRTGSPTIALADLFGFILYTGTGGTAALPAIAGVPAGCGFPVLNLGTGTLTLDPNGTETINDATTLVLAPGEGAWVFPRTTATAAWIAIVSRLMSHPRNAQTGITYTYVTGDRAKHVTHSNAASIAGTLPQAGSAFPDGWFMFVQNKGAGVLTITPTTSTIGGGTALKLRQNEVAIVTSDGTNYDLPFHSGQVTGAPSAREVGTRGIPQNIQNAAYSFTLDDIGGHVEHDEATGRTWTIPANASVAFPIGSAIVLTNGVGVGDITLVITTDTLRRGDGTAGTGTRTIKPNSVATIIKRKATEWSISGAFT